MVAGILAASLSTYDSIGSALSALLTRDVYARLLVPGRDDRHYLRISQWLTPAVIAISFFYIPGLLRGGMVLYYLDLTSAFVIPLLTIYLMGSFTRVHRSSGLIGLLAGAAYGILRMAAPLVAEQTGWVLLPPVMMGTYAAYPFSMLVTARDHGAGFPGDRMGKRQSIGPDQPPGRERLAAFQSTQDTADSGGNLQEGSSGTAPAGLAQHPGPGGRMCSDVCGLLVIRGEPAFLTGGSVSPGKVFVFSILKRLFGRAFRVQTAVGPPWLF